jgi:hypothetical protein
MEPNIVTVEPLWPEYAEYFAQLPVSAELDPPLPGLLLFPLLEHAASVEIAATTAAATPIVRPRAMCCPFPTVDNHAVESGYSGVCQRAHGA